MGDASAATMRAVLMHGHGGPEVLRPGAVPQPKPGRGELLVRVGAASVNPLDYKVRRGELWFLTRWRLPFVPGTDLAGEVVDTGPGVSDLREGDAAYAVLNGVRGGAYAEYAVVPARQAGRRPANVSVEEAASLPVAALTALQALRDRSRLRPGQRVLINGASGGVGTLAVQVGKILDAHVTAVCGGAARGLVESLGADRVIDYRERNFATEPERYDVVFDVVGNRSFRECRGVLTERGVFVTTQPFPRHAAAHLLTAFAGGRRAKTMIVFPRRIDLDRIRELVEQRRLRPVVDRVFPLAEAAAAHAYLERGHPRGKVVLRVGAA